MLSDRDVEMVVRTNAETTFALEQEGSLRRGGVLDLIGVGIGPANLSLAALLDPMATITRCFFERRAEFSWHEGQLLPEAELQQVYMKDLVSLVAPSSRFSFVSYLHEKGRLYAFLNARFPAVLRQEFDQYLRWASASLAHLRFGEEVTSIRFADYLIVETGRGRMAARAVVLGTGQAPRIPHCAKACFGDTVFHGSEFTRYSRSWAGKSVAIVGGGQTGAEIFLNLVTRVEVARPTKICWLSRRSNFLPLDDTPFVNEQFFPSYSDYFYTLEYAVRSRLLMEQKLASDGISASVLTRIYQRLYELRFLSDSRGLECRLLPFREMTALARHGAGWRIRCMEMTTGAEESFEADVVILCTGFEYRMPECLSPIAHRLRWGPDGFVIRPDFSIEWDGPGHLRIYVQNAARAKRGIADPNLSLLSWRSAKIANSIAGRVLYRLDESQMFMSFGPSGVALKFGSTSPPCGSAYNSPETTFESVPQ
jgi:lysine N6-hydroxylase